MGVKISYITVNGSNSTILEVDGQRKIWYKESPFQGGGAVVKAYDKEGILIE